MADFQAMFRVSADPSHFQAGMSRAEQTATAFSKSMGRLGLSIGSTFGVVAVMNWARATMDAAVQVRDEIEKAGGKVDSLTGAAARLGDTMSAVRETTKSWGIAFLGFLARSGEGLGAAINRLRGISREQEELRAQAARDADEAERRLKKSREENSPEKLAAAEKALQAERRKNLLETESIQGRINILTAEWVQLNEEIEKLGANTVARKQKELELEKLSGEIRKANSEQDKQVNAELEAFFKSVEEGAKRLQEKEAERRKIAQDLAALAEREAEAKAKQLEIEANLKKLNDQQFAQAVGFMSGSTLDITKVQDASDAALAEILRRKQENLASLGPDRGRGLTFDDNYFTRIQIQNDIARVKAELDLRENLRQSVAAGGIEGARRAFGGDPFVFDRLVEQFVIDSRTTKEIQAETLSTLRRMEDRQKTGAPVVVMNAK